MSGGREITQKTASALGVDTDLTNLMMALVEGLIKYWSMTLITKGVHGGT
jgi:hypothetical protein